MSSLWCQICNRALAACSHAPTITPTTSSGAGGKVAKQYYAYVPFDDGTPIKAAVEKWISNMPPAPNAQRQIDSLKAQIADPGKYGLERFQVDDLKAKLTNMERELALRLCRQKTPIILSHKGGDKCLQILDSHSPDEYVLYIVGHCSAGKDFIHDDQSSASSKEHITFTDLAERLIADGMPGTIVNLKLLACFAGAASERGDEAFAAKLFAKLTGRFTSMKLTAYKKAVLISEFYASGFPHKTAAVLDIQDGVLKGVSGRTRLSGEKEVWRPATNNN